MPAGPGPVAPPPVRLGPRRGRCPVLGHLDPGWWREGALLPSSLATLDMADPYRCVLGWWAAQHLPAPPRRGPRQVPPYDRAMLALGLPSQQAQALGFTGGDADLLTPGWRHLITYLRATHDQRAAMNLARPLCKTAPATMAGCPRQLTNGDFMKTNAMMLVDCPAYLDARGRVRCGLPAEIHVPYLLHSTGGPLESARIQCPRGHYFNGPIQSLTWDKNQAQPGYALITSPSTGLDQACDHATGLPATSGGISCPDLVCGAPRPRRSRWR